MRPSAKSSFPEPLPAVARRWRVLLGIVAILSAAAAVELSFWHRSQRPLVGHLSLHGWLALSTAIGISVASFLLALRTPGWMMHGIERLARPAAFERSGAKALLLLLLALLPLAAACYQAVPAGSALSPDEAHFLRLAAGIRDSGGPVALIRDLYAGRWSESNRHPLYPALLALAGATPAAAIALSTAAIGLSLLALYKLLRLWQFNASSAAAGTVLASASAALVRSAVSTLADAALCAGVLGCWCTVAASSRAGSSRRRLLYAAAAGLAAGTAYLTKATALLWCGPLLLVTFWPNRVERCVALSTALAVALLISSPLWVCNLRRFGNPIYNYNQRFLFADSFDANHPAEPSLRAAAAKFLDRHGWQGVARRACSGILWEAVIICRGTAPPGPEPLRLVIGTAVVALATTAVVLRAATAADAALLSTLTLAYAAFGWYVPIAASERLVLPAIALLTGLGSAALATLCPTDRSRRALAIVVAVGTCAVVLLAPPGFWPKL